MINSLAMLMKKVEVIVTIIVILICIIGVIVLFIYIKIDAIKDKQKFIEKYKKKLTKKNYNTKICNFSKKTVKSLSLTEMIFLIIYKYKELFDSDFSTMYDYALFLLDFYIYDYYISYKNVEYDFMYKRLYSRVKRVVHKKYKKEGKIYNLDNYRNLRKELTKDLIEVYEIYFAKDKGLLFEVIKNDSVKYKLVNDTQEKIDEIKEEKLNLEKVEELQGLLNKFNNDYKINKDKFEIKVQK